jgi:hypothetical protein
MSQPSHDPPLLRQERWAARSACSHSTADVSALDRLPAFKHLRLGWLAKNTSVDWLWYEWIRDGASRRHVSSSFLGVGLELRCST